jgi:hypothetical protein
VLREFRGIMIQEMRDLLQLVAQGTKGME